MATLRPSLFSRWLTQPTELLLRTTRANPFQSQRLSLTLRPKFSAGAPRTRSFNVLARRTRPTHLQPRQRTTLPTRRSTSTNSSSSTTTTSSNTSAKENNSLSQRLRTLSREYGWAALGVYLGLSALDFPFCFLAVRLLGVERIGHWEHVVVSSVKDVVKSVWPQAGSDSAERSREAEEGGALVSAEEEGNMEEASIWTQLALAYAVHKSLIFIRVPLTAAVTPKIVKVLRRWGWDIGKRKPKSG